MLEDKEIRKVARCVQTILQLEDVAVTTKRIMGIIEGEDMTDAFKLKEKVVAELKKTDNKKSTSNSRRKVIEEFVVGNWDLIKDNEIVKTALLNSYCMGRYKKDRRDEMVGRLLLMAEGGTTLGVVPVPAVVVPVPEEVVEVKEGEVKEEFELRTESPEDHRDFDF